MGERLYRTRVIQKILKKKREHRLNFLLSKVKLWPGMSILDVGCGPDGRSLENLVSTDYRIVGIDIIEPCHIKISHPGFTYIQQDACDLSRFSDNEFDLAVSIGMVEHICEDDVILKVAKEIDRISKQYVITAPWKFTWIEPHFKFPFFQLLPYKLQRALTMLFDLHLLGETVKKDPGYIRDHYQWLSSKKWQQIFVGSQVYLQPYLIGIGIIKA